MGGRDAEPRHWLSITAISQLNMAPAPISIAHGPIRMEYQSSVHAGHGSPISSTHNSRGDAAAAATAAAAAAAAALSVNIDSSPANHPLK